MDLNQYLAKFQDYVTHMPKDELYSYISIFVGISLILISVAIW